MNNPNLKSVAIKREKSFVAPTKGNKKTRYPVDLIAFARFDLCKAFDNNTAAQIAYQRPVDCTVYSV